MCLKNAIDRDSDWCCSSRWCVLHSRESLVILMTRGSAHQSFETLIHLSFEALSLSLYIILMGSIKASQDLIPSLKKSTSAQTFEMVYRYLAALWVVGHLLLPAQSEEKLRRSMLKMD